MNALIWFGIGCFVCDAIIYFNCRGGGDGNIAAGLFLPVLAVAGLISFGIAGVIAMLF